MSLGRSDKAALFKYLMELTGCADLKELGGELKVRQQTQLHNYVRSVIEVTNKQGESV